MAAVPPISDSISAPPSRSLVLPPSGTSQPALGLPATDTTQAGSASVAAEQTSGSTSTDTAASFAATTSPLAGTSTQPLTVVLEALATAGVDTAVNQELLAPTVGQAVGTFSIFMEELLTALAAQSAAAQQSAQSTAAQQTAPVASQTPASTNTPLDAFATTSPSTAPNSALENDVQSLAQTVNAQRTDAALTTEARSTSTTTLSPLQRSFEQFVTEVGGTPNSTTLGGFLQALATNLHTAQTPLGNIVNSQT